MSNNDIDKAYISPYDRFLFEFDSTHKKSESQLKEIKKHQRLAAMRDTPKKPDEQDKLFKDF